MSSRLITIGCLQMGKARRSGNLHLNPFRPIPTLTNPQHGARPKEASWTIGFPGSSHHQLLFNLHCAAPQSYCKFLGNGFSVAPVNELYDTDASGYSCPGRSTRVGPNLFYLILPAKKILLCSACRSPKTCKLGLEHTAIVRDTPVATARMPLAVRRWPALSAACLAVSPRVSVSPSVSTQVSEEPKLTFSTALNPNEGRWVLLTQRQQESLVSNRLASPLKQCEAATLTVTQSRL